ncbi:MAG: hypothetical protein Q8P53_00720 [Candidatus Shapirobacteria bacterium]|nr:hypothetical protein [Candidatus Shapirobacteria bacterium]
MTERLTGGSEISRTIEGERTFPTLDNLQEHFINLYDRRNNVYLPGRNIRIELFYRGVADLVDAVRKEANEYNVENMLARVVSRIFCIANGINNVSVAEGMRIKYPANGCFYCHNVPCQCQEKRNEPDTTLDVSSAQKNWSLKDWQKHLNNLYGDKNKNHGISYMLLRLSSEMGELITEEHQVSKRMMDEIESGYQLELADSLAWTIAVANFLNIDIQHAVESRYKNGCQKCSQPSCVCGPHSFDQIRFNI